MVSLLLRQRRAASPLQEIEHGKRNHEVKYDGEALVWPNGYRDPDSIQQARLAAKDLSEWLTGSSDVPVPVVPVVVIPGWMVNRAGKGAVHVFNDKELLRIRDGKADNLTGLASADWTEEQRRAIADRIEAHCRNVDQC